MDALGLPPGTDFSKIPIVPPPPGVTPNFVNPPSLYVIATAIVSVVLASEIIVVSLRLLSRYTTAHKLGADDICCICATILTFGTSYFVLYFRSTSRHGWDIPLSWITGNYIKHVYAEQMFMGPTNVLAKSSLLLLYYRVFAPKKWVPYSIFGAIIFAIGTQMSLNIIDSIYCTPDIGNPWDIRTSLKCAGHARSYTVVQGVANVVLDLFILCLPIPIVWRLQLQLQKKLGIIAVFMTGLLAIASSIVGLHYRIQLWQARDSGYAGRIVVLCATAENGISIICSSAPALAHVTKTSFMRKSFLSSFWSNLVSGRRPSSRPSDSSPPSSSRYPEESKVFDSYSRLPNNGSIDWPYSDSRRDQVCTTDIQAASPVSDMEKGVIAKSITVSQSSWNGTHG